MTMQTEYHILVVDDDRAIVNILKTSLRQAGYQVSTADNGNMACRIAEQSHPMLSARAEGSDRVLGLEAGADDYLVKPFFQQELLARVKALLRRYDHLGSIREENTKEEKLSVGDIILNLSQKKLYVRGEPVRLTATEFKILQLMMAHPGRIFPAEEIYERVWNTDAYAVENTVMIHISRIREKLEINPRKPEYLKVIWGIGYVFEKP